MSCSSSRGMTRGSRRYIKVISYVGQMIGGRLKFLLLSDKRGNAHCRWGGVKGALLVCTAEFGCGRTWFIAFLVPKIIENGGHLKSNGKQVSDFHEYEYVVERSSASMFQSSGHSDLAG